MRFESTANSHAYGIGGPLTVNNNLGRILE